MTTISQLVEVFRYLEAKGFGNQYVSAEHDCIYLPGTEDLEEMKQWAHWDSYYSCWCMFT